MTTLKNVNSTALDRLQRLTGLPEEVLKRIYYSNPREDYKHCTDVENRREAHE